MQVQAGEVPPVNGNASELGEVLMNLILNAADALPAGGNISIGSRAEGDWVLVEVKDDGVGMNGEVARRVFDPFFTTKGAEGVGLGLSVAYGIVARHGGELLVESSPGAGSTFTIRLPVATVMDLKSDRQPEPLADPGRPARILVIDDVEMIRSLLTVVLEGAGHTVVTAGSGNEGLESFRHGLANGAGAYDLVMTDLGIPGLSGWDVVDGVKRLSPETPVILITGWGDQLDRERMQESRADAVLAKPFETREVLDLVARSVSRS